MNPDNIIVGLAGIAGILTEIALFSNFGGGGFNLIGVGWFNNYIQRIRNTYQKL